jgi:hypothetical protein
MSEVFLTREEIEHPYANLAVMIEDKRKKAEQMRQTVFVKITQSPEVLAPEFVYCEETLTDGDIWYSLLLGDVGYATKREAVSATLAKLKEVCQ